MAKHNKHKKKETKKGKSRHNGKKHMSDANKEHAVFADATYNSNKKALRKIQAALGTDWEVDRERSTRKRKVFRNTKDHRVVYSARGTKPTDLKDLKTDAAIVASRFKKNAFKDSKRMRNERKHYAEFTEAYKDWQREGTGHSLGGAIIAELTKGDDDVLTTAFARGTVRNHGNYGSNLTDIANRRDLISNHVFGQKGNQSKIMVGRKKSRYLFDRLGAHDMSQFL